MNANIFEKANQILRTCDAAYIGVIDEDGGPSVSTASPLKQKDIFTVYLSTGFTDNKAVRLLKNNKASVCFRSGGDNITLAGTAEVLTGQKIKDEFWEDWFIEHFPKGTTDPYYCVIKFTTKRVSLWVDRESSAFTIDELMKVQSRCGILCDRCGYKESHGCTGCISRQGKLFWGECPIAMCCQGKDFSHCGECPDFPCGTLKEFSCGDGPECDKPKGARIEICKAWRRRR